jgi:hypothetical protein
MRLAARRILAYTKKRIHARGLSRVGGSQDTDTSDDCSGLISALIIDGFEFQHRRIRLC